MAIGAPPNADRVARAQRAVEQIDAARRASGRRAFHCRNAECRRFILEYQPPIGEVLVRCRRCGLYSSLTTETPA